MCFCTHFQYLRPQRLLHTAIVHAEITKTCKKKTFKLLMTLTMDNLKKKIYAILYRRFHYAHTPLSILQCVITEWFIWYKSSNDNSSSTYKRYFFEIYRVIGEFHACVSCAVACPSFKLFSLVLFSWLSLTLDCPETRFSKCGFLTWVSAVLYKVRLSVLTRGNHHSARKAEVFVKPNLCAGVLTYL